MSPKADWKKLFYLMIILEMETMTVAVLPNVYKDIKNRNK